MLVRHRPDMQVEDRVQGKLIFNVELRFIQRLRFGSRKVFAESRLRCLHKRDHAIAVYFRLNPPNDLGAVRANHRRRAFDAEAVRDMLRNVGVSV